MYSLSARLPSIIDDGVEITYHERGFLPSSTFEMKASWSLTHFIPSMVFSSTRPSVYV